ncbi:MAG: putative peptidoglycan glycosyltransferase FtsW [Planctomycetota bacterium]
MLDIKTKSSGCSTAITIVAAALLALGVVMVFSATASLTSPPVTDNPLRNPSLRQALFTGIALVALLLVRLCPYQSWRIRKGTFFQPAIYLLILAIAALVAVLLVGEDRNGAKRWLSVGPASLGLGFQPSEVAKLALVIFLAAYCGRIGQRIRLFWSGFLPAVLTLGLVAGLIGIEDFGTAALLVTVGACLLLCAGVKIWHFCLAGLPAIAGLVYLVLARPYRIERLTAFLDPYADPLGKSYHQIQSLITIASGGWWGHGLGCGIQKYGYLPEGRNDFIFAVICEELGLIGGIAVIGLFAIFLWQGKRAAANASSEFGRLLALGATLMIGFQAAMNIAVVTVAAPTKGIGLPFVSAGGSGVLLLSVLVGLLANVARHDAGGSTAARCIPLRAPPAASGVGCPGAIPDGAAPT